jgi:hypothetical protein
MVLRWNCRHCWFTTWGASKQAVAKQVKSHIVSHHQSSISSGDFHLQWDCPYCSESGLEQDEREGLRAFKSHLYKHVAPLIEEGKHVGDDINGTGNVLVLAPLESQGAENARTHFLAPSDIAIFVTTKPTARIRLLQNRLDELPAWTSVITSNEDPFGAESDIDISNVPIDVVQLKSTHGLSGLGTALAKVLSEHESASGKISVEFDIFSEIVASFDLQEVFKFLHILGSRFEKADALSHFYFDPTVESNSTLNLLREAFDLTIRPEDEVFRVPTQL